MKGEALSNRRAELRIANDSSSILEQNIILDRRLDSPQAERSPFNGSIGFKSPPVSEGGGTVPSEFYDAEEDRSEGSGQERRRVSLFPEDPFSDGAALSESIKASDLAGRSVSNIPSLSSAEPPALREEPLPATAPPAVDEQYSDTARRENLNDKQKTSSSSTSSEPETQPLQRVMSSPVGGVITKSKSNGSSPLGAIRSPALSVSDSPAQQSPERYEGLEDTNDKEAQWLDSKPFELSSSTTKTAVVKHTRLVACEFDESELLDEDEVSRFMGDEGELCSTDAVGSSTITSSGLFPAHLAPLTLVTPLPYDYPLLLPRPPVRMETVFEEHEEITSLFEKERSSDSRSSSSSTSNCSTENDRLKFEDMLGMRVEKINIESSKGALPVTSLSSEKHPLNLSRPPSESQQTETVTGSRPHRWSARLRGRFARKAIVSRKGSSEHGNARSRRGSGTFLLERLIGRKEEKTPNASRYGMNLDEQAMASARSLPLFPSYLRYNQNGWFRVPVKSRADAGEKQSAKVMNLCKGFESVWLIDKDDILVGVKEWLHSSHFAPMADQYQSMTPATSPTTSSIRPSRRGRGTQTPTPPPAPDSGISGGPIWCLALSKDGRYLAAGSRKGLIYVWEIILPAGKSENHALGERCLRRRGGFAGHTGGVISMHWSGNPHSYVLVSCAVDKTVRIWTLHCDTTLAILRCTSVPVGTLFTKTDFDDQIVVAGLDGSVKLVNLTPPPSTFKPQNANEPPPLVNCEAIASYNFAEAITSLSISPDGRFLTCGMQYGSVTIQNLENGMVEKQIECRNRRGKHAKGEKITGIDWSQNPNGDFICVTARDSRIRVISVKDEAQQLKLKGSDIRLKAFFAPGSRFVIGVTEVNRVAIWDLLEAGRITPSRSKTGSLRLSSSHRRKSDLDTLKPAHTAPLLKSQISSLTDSVPDGDSTGCHSTSIAEIHTPWIPPLPTDVKKRPTAAAVGSFKVPENAITALLVSSVHSDDCRDGYRPVQIICGTTLGSLHVFMALVTP